MNINQKVIVKETGEANEIKNVYKFGEEIIYEIHNDSKGYREEELLKVEFESTGQDKKSFNVTEVKIIPSKIAKKLSLEEQAKVAAFDKENDEIEKLIIDASNLVEELNGVLIKISDKVVSFGN